ncbi:hypothetical protein NMY22_g8465 [Coprinellus aureogranulatus]|nr:hypothetical protein NMY22_g8465 [Coprinellus aureogranulatus]
MRLPPIRRQIGFFVDQPWIPADTSCSHVQQPQSPSPPPVPRYEPLYLVSYGSASTPASQGTWCIVMADDIPDISGRISFSLHGMFRQIGVAKKKTVESTDATVKRRKQRVRFLVPDLEQDQETRKDSKRRKTDREATRTSTSPPPMSDAERLRVLNTHHVRDEVRRFPLRSAQHSVDQSLKHSDTIVDCLQDPSGTTAPFDEPHLKVLGVIEIAQLPLNVDITKKRRVLEKIRLELWHGRFRGVPLEEARREWALQIVNDLTREWRVGIKGVLGEFKATAQDVVTLFDFQTANL